MAGPSMLFCFFPQNEKVEFEDATCWTIDIVMSTGEGKPKMGEAKTTVFRRAAEEKYSLKQKASRELLSHVTKVYDTLGFSMRSAREAVGSKALLGVKEMLEHEMLVEYPGEQEGLAFHWSLTGGWALPSVLYEKKTPRAARVGG